MKLAERLSSHTVSIAFISVLVTCIILGWTCYKISKNSVTNLIYERLTIERDLKKSRIDAHFKELRNEIIKISKESTIAEAMVEFKKGFHIYINEIQEKNYDSFKKNVINHYRDTFVNKFSQLNGGQLVDPRPLFATLNKTAFFLQYQYIMNNPNSVGSKHKLNTVLDGTTYSKAHEIYHPKIREMLEIFNYYDMFLVDSDTGDVVYTTYKELDFAASLKSKIYSKSKIAKVFREANRSKNPDFITFSDFDEYLPSYNKQAGFIATSIIHEGKKLGVLIVEVSIDELNNILNYDNKWEELGLLPSSESYIVGSDKLLRTINRNFLTDTEEYLKKLISQGSTEVEIKKMFYKKSNIGMQKFDNKAIDYGLEGKRGFEITEKFGEPTISSYTYLDALGTSWVLVNDVSIVDAFSGVNKLFYRILLFTFIICIVVIAFAAYSGSLLAQFIAAPIVKFKEELLDIAHKKDLTKRIEEVPDADEEIQDMTTAMNTMLTNIQALFKQTAQSSAEMHAAAQRLLNMSHEEGLEDFDESVNSTGDSIENLSDKLDDISMQFKIFEEEDDEKRSW